MANYLSQLPPLPLYTSSGEQHDEVRYLLEGQLGHRYSTVMEHVPNLWLVPGGWRHRTQNRGTEMNAAAYLELVRPVIESALAELTEYKNSLPPPSDNDNLPKIPKFDWWKEYRDRFRNRGTIRGRPW